MVTKQHPHDDKGHEYLMGQKNVMEERRAARVERIRPLLDELAVITKRQSELVGGPTCGDEATGRGITGADFSCHMVEIARRDGNLDEYMRLLEREAEINKEVMEAKREEVYDLLDYAPACMIPEALNSIQASMTAAAVCNDYGMLVTAMFSKAMFSEWHYARVQVGVEHARNLQAVASN